MYLASVSLILCFVLVSELAASLEESRDELQVVKRKNTALIKVSVCFASSIKMRMKFIMFIDTCTLYFDVLHITVCVDISVIKP